MPQTRTLLSVQTGQARRMRMAGRSLVSAMVKLPVQGPVPVGPLGLLGDEQAEKLIQTAEVEAQKVAFERRYGPDTGSGTQPFIQGAREIDESTGADSDIGAMVIETLTNPVGALKRGSASLINYGVDRLTQPGQIAARDAIGQLYLNDPRELAAFLEANPVNVPAPVFPGPRAPNPFALTPRAPISAPRPRSSR
jgi:hypothetical protein